MTLLLQYSALSNRGLVRGNNEDSAYAGPRLLALADGMGGHAAGEVASRLIIEHLAPLDLDERRGDLLDALSGAIADGNASIAEQVAASPELDGMGTTLTAILFAGNRLALCHVGDSRGYLYRDGALTQITRDDTFVQTLVDEGRITAEQAHTHPQRSLIMKALTGQEVEPTLTMREARAGDRYLLCSDGLSDVVSNETIGDILGSTAQRQECAEKLVALALRSGGPDNITVIVADVIDTDYGDTHPIIVGAAGTADDDGDTPDPQTAAGRAAALRPQPQRIPAATPTEPEPVAARRSWRTPIIAVLTVIVIVVAAVVVTSLIFWNKYFIADTDGEGLSIYRGSPETLLTFTRERTGKVCLDDAHTNDATVSVREADAVCTPLRLDDLQQTSRKEVEGFFDKVDTREKVENVVRSVRLLPLCEPPAGDTADQDPTGAPTPDPRSPQPQVPPAGGDQTGDQQAGAPTGGDTTATLQRTPAPTVPDTGDRQPSPNGDGEQADGSGVGTAPQKCRTR